MFWCVVVLTCLFLCQGSSSIGAVNAQFLAAFSAAAGKRSLQFSESEESDPDVSVSYYHIWKFELLLNMGLISH